MNDIEKMTDWLSGFPGWSRLEKFRVDLTDHLGENGGIFPGGLVERSRRTDIFGNVTVVNRYSFGLYFVLQEPGQENAVWLLELQNWIQQESMLGRVPVFGDRTLSITARKGALRRAEDDGTALYSAEIAVDFERGNAADNSCPAGV